LRLRGAAASCSARKFSFPAMALPYHRPGLGSDLDHRNIAHGVRST
jgi:hypothetical protein